MKVRAAWQNVGLTWVSGPGPRTGFGDSVALEIAAHLDGLDDSDVRVELLLDRPGPDAGPAQVFRFQHRGRNGKGEDRYTLSLTPNLCGKLEYRVRVYPYHELLSHPFEMGMMVWL